MSSERILRRVGKSRSRCVLCPFYVTRRPPPPPFYILTPSPPLPPFIFRNTHIEVVPERVLTIFCSWVIRSVCKLRRYFRPRRLLFPRRWEPRLFRDVLIRVTSKFLSRDPRKWEQFAVTIARSVIVYFFFFFCIKRNSNWMHSAVLLLYIFWYVCVLQSVSWDLFREQK